ncbi:MAG: sodium ion-translocating decarboxylase subunit beta, partial [Candidatus Moranbacteria bacterium]|nr:sodium ion-translocating decarboxylase subunit beta [Candidatus Moranbacteria bacterium]
GKNEKNSFYSENDNNKIESQRFLQFIHKSNELKSNKYVGVIHYQGEKINLLPKIFFDSGIMTEIFPVLIFIGIGAMIDFTPLLQNPRMIFFGAAAQFGIFFTILAALFFGFDLKESASIGIIGAADGPTSIFVASRFASHLLAPITVAAYSYMALVPIIQPVAIKLVTTKKERAIRMPYNPKSVSRMTRLLFPVIVTLIAGYVAPASVSLVGLLMFGNKTVKKIS